MKKYPLKMSQGPLRIPGPDFETAIVEGIKRIYIIPSKSVHLRFYQQSCQILLKCRAITALSGGSHPFFSLANYTVLTTGSKTNT